MAVLNGVDNLHSYKSLFAGKRLGLVTNPTGVTCDLRSTVDVLRRDFNLTALYGPEHGIYGDAQAGEAVEGQTDRRTGLPAFSLYGSTKHLTPAMAAACDLIVFDIQDVGSRYYTYLYTLSYLMQSCAEYGLPLVVLDRVNPINGVTVQGNVLDERFASFVGEYALPARYALTIGEYAQYINQEKSIDCDLTVIPLSGWSRDMHFEDTGLPWVMPSPNLPTPLSALCYTGTCLIEGTNLSEGRGTTKPFELIGAPWLDGHLLSQQMNDLDLPGVRFRPAFFRPSFSKHAGTLCGGLQVHVTDRTVFDAFGATLHLIDRVRSTYEEFEFISTGERPFIHSLMGSDAVTQVNFCMNDYINSFDGLISEFERIKTKHILY